MSISRGYRLSPTTPLYICHACIHPLMIRSACQRNNGAELAKTDKTCPRDYPVGQRLREVFEENRKIAARLKEQHVQ